MSKDKRKKKFFQGMEHLQKEFKGNETAKLSSQSAGINQVDRGLTTEHIYIRKDLIGVMIIMSLIFVAFAALTYIDKTSDVLTNFADKITSLVIK
jgi:hypothetical protein